VILRHADALWTFVYIEGSRANNTAERAVRHGEILRNISGGAHCQEGSRFAYPFTAPGLLAAAEIRSVSEVTPALRCSSQPY